MQADFFFRMGAAHTVCQDYALAGERDGIQYAIVSDGCSGIPIAGEPGAPFTDFGARFLAKAAQQRVREIADNQWPCEAMLADAASAARLLSLPSVALDATLFVAVASSRYAYVFETGDGVTVVRHRNGTIKYWSAEFGSNMPFYMSYLLDQQRLQRYLSEAETMTVARGVYANRATELTRQDRLFAMLADAVWNKFETSQPIDTYVRRHIFDSETVDVVLVLSDGVKTFTNTTGAPVPLEQVLEQLLAFKGFQGQFIGRRCQRFLGSFCAERGWKHADDFSVAGIYLGERP